MQHCHTKVRTQFASKYLQQLCKHFAHKVEVEFDRTVGRVAFPGGLCLMLAEDDGLSFFGEAHAEEGVPRIKSVIDSHLIKFAWREDLSIEWQDGLPERLPVDRLPSLKEFTIQ
ncbi:MAG: DUF2218 domain-containing protein [Alphaproteobacteria bacterium]|nr:DUF2218 domain-containing protein [Alphaproteobacteria bacterium]